jgi:integrase
VPFVPVYTEQTVAHSDIVVKGGTRMPRPRSGNLVTKPAGFFARLRVNLPNGAATRRWLDLQTKDRATAQRKLARLVDMIEAGELIADAHAKAVAPETYRSYSQHRHEQREAAGVVMASDERNNRERYIYPVIGHLQLRRINEDHVRQVLERARDLGLSRETVRKIRGVMSRDFKRAKLEKLVPQNPVQDVLLPERLKTDKRPRTILTDAEISRFLEAPRCDLEIKMLSLVARAEGGMRTAELVRWDWQMIDTTNFATCTIMRAKSGDFQRLEVPTMLRPFLRTWWELNGRPISGPVFPVRRGPRSGQAKKGHNTSFAKSLRRELFKAGIVRRPPIEAPATKKGTRTDLGKRAPGSKLAPNPGDPLYFDTQVSRRVDFHSFRRAYNTALARAGVNLQQAMVLASHTDPKTHMGYVMAAEATKPLPDSALPKVDPTRFVWAPTGAQSPRVTANSSMKSTPRLTRNDAPNPATLRGFDRVLSSPSKPRVAGSSPAGRAGDSDDLAASAPDTFEGPRLPSTCVALVHARPRCPALEISARGRRLAMNAMLHPCTSRLAGRLQRPRCQGERRGFKSLLTLQNPGGTPVCRWCRAQPWQPHSTTRGIGLRRPARSAGSRGRRCDSDDQYAALRAALGEGHWSGQMCRSHREAPVQYGIDCLRPVG